jgi:hypothetical protein
MTRGRATLDYQDWTAACDTLHALTQLLGKLSAALAPPERDFQHIALRLTARGWETAPLPAPDGTGAIVVCLDLRRHEALVEHSGGGERRSPLAPARSVGEVTRDVLAAVGELGGQVEIDPTPQEVHWSVALDQDEEHVDYDPVATERYFEQATRAALALAVCAAPHLGRRSPLNAWWGSLDLAVSLFWEMPERELAVGWWPGDPRYPRAAFYAYLKPAGERQLAARIEPQQAHWDDALGEFVLDQRDVSASLDDRACVLAFARSVQAAADL